MGQSPPALLVSSGLVLYCVAGANVNRIVLLAKGNVDVHDSLHSCRIGGQLQWNGINELIRKRGDCVARLRHETWTRSDAVLEATGVIPTEITERSLPLGTYPATSQFGTTLFDTDADVVVLSILGETATTLYRHKEEGYLFYPANSDTWSPENRQWLRNNFEREELLGVSQSMENFANIIARVRARRDVPILVYNASSIIPGEGVHNYQGLDETYATRCKRFNLALVSLSKETGISIVDVDTIIARSGADRLKLDAMHLTAEGYRLVAEEVVRVLADLGTVPSPENESCAPV
jgi:hypothetical protein